MKKRSESALAFLLLLTAAVYGQVLWFEFVRWDDNVFIFENKMMFLPFGEAMNQAFTSLFNRDYLPISMMSWWLDCWLGGEPNAGISHFGNLALHLTNLALVWLCLKPLVSTRVNFFVCLVFALHPIQVESVALASSRNNLLCATFALLAILCAQRLERGWRYWIGYSLFHGFALLSKAIVVFTPLILISCDWFVHRRRWREILKRHVIPLALSASMVFLRVVAYRHSNSQFGQVSMDLGRFAEVPLQALNAVGFYFSKIVVPRDFAIIYPLFEITPMTWFQAGLILIVIVVSAIQWRQPKSSILLLSLSWIFFFFLPVMQILPRLNYVADRYNYLPIVGVALWMALTLQWMFRPLQHIAVVATAIVAVLLGVLTWKQIETFQDDMHLWKYTTIQRPDSAVARMNLAGTLERAGLIDQAIVEYEKSSQGRYEEDTSAQALSNLALIHSKLEYPNYYNLHTALHYMKLAEEKPIDESSRFYLRYNRARLESVVGNKQQAKMLAEKLLKDLEGNPDSMLNQVRDMTLFLLRTL